MSTYTARRGTRKRRDTAGIFLFVIVLLAVPVVGYFSYLFLTNPAQLEAYGLKPIETGPGAGQPVQPAKVAPAAVATGTPAAPQKNVAAVKDAEPASPEMAKAEPRSAAPKRPAPGGASSPVGPPTKSGRPGNVAQAVENIGASIYEALNIPKKVMVVWLVDESNSNADYRRDLRDALDKMYASLKQTKPEADQPLDDQPLLSVVAAYGRDVRFATPEPTADAAEVTRAVHEIVDADNATENTILAVDASLTKFLPYRSQKGRHLMFVIVSDEVGDDQAKVDTVLPKLKQYTIPVYTIGIVAPFGTDGQTTKLQEQGGGIIGIPDPSSAKGDFKVVYGPESHDVEWIKLAYPDGSGDTDLGDLDMGPYTLSRLCLETGGEYFALRTRRFDSSWGAAPMRVSVAGSGGGDGNRDTYFAALGAAGGSDRPLPKFEDAVVIAPPTNNAGLGAMTVNYKKYAPAYLSEADYQKSIAANKAKQALLAAAKLPPVNVLPSNVKTTVTATDEARRVRELLDMQKYPAIVQPHIDALYNELKKGESDSAKLTEPRWKAAFDLAFGRVSAAKARADGYMFQIAAIRNGKSATGLQPSDEPMKNSVVDKLAATARERLQTVVKEHPGTPWARAAERELRTPMGWKLIE